mmetsp:Transcript_26334/g.47807  ORF Transcript_26334/g.47807 Transcript_26334/m.47807 type:complete len:256 (+) Transcript_26334:263-1030(+)
MPAATGIARELYPSAHRKFSRIRKYIVFARSIATKMSVSLELTRTMPAASCAILVPLPIAIPTSASASAGESLMPSPTIATRSPSERSRLTYSIFPAGKTSAITLAAGIPMSWATARAVLILSPVNMWTLMPNTCCKTLTVRAASSFAWSIIPRTASVRPFIDTATAVRPIFSRYSIASNVPGVTLISFAARQRRFPMCTVTLPTVHLTPFPTSASKCSTSSRGRVCPCPIPRSSALVRIALAIGCSLLCSAQAE